MPSNIIKLEFDGAESNASVVNRLLPTIEYYRGQKRTLAAIHQALSESGEVSMAFASFKNAYYSQRIKSGSQPTGLDNLPVQSVEHTEQAGEVIEKAKSSPDVVGINAETDLQVDTRTGIKPDMTLAEKREISAQLFRQRNT